MKLLKTLTEKYVGASEAGINKNINYKKREAARAVVMDADGKAALLFNGKCHHHKIPGGGVDLNEDVNKALRREVREEAGCEIEVIAEIGKIIEYRNKYQLKQTSYCWLAKVKGDKREPRFEEDEIADGFVLRWVARDKARELFKNDKPKLYEGLFMHARDRLFLEEGLRMLKKKLHI